MFDTTVKSTLPFTISRWSEQTQEWVPVHSFFSPRAKEALAMLTRYEQAAPADKYRLSSPL